MYSLYHLSKLLGLGIFRHRTSPFIIYHYLAKMSQFLQFSSALYFRFNNEHINTINFSSKLFEKILAFCIIIFKNLKYALLKIKNRGTINHHHISSRLTKNGV